MRKQKKEVLAHSRPDTDETVKRYSFCENVHAVTSFWHIRKLTKEGQKFGGGVDTGSLCGRVKAPHGWDLNVELTIHHLKHACPKCVDLYLSHLDTST